MTPVIRLNDVSLGWRDKPVLQHVSGQFNPGTLTAILGANGAGKSTLVKGIIHFLKPTAGSIDIDPAFRKELTLLPQLSDLDRSFPITTYELVAMGAWRRIGPWRQYGKAERARINHALEQVGLQAVADQLIGNLSGGQLQRALFARLMVRDAKVLLLDEPFAAVDEDTCEDLMRIILGWHAEGRTIIAVLHDVDRVKRCFPETLLLARQVVAWGKTAEILTEENLHKARRLSLGGF
ncbi:ABC transporter ATP-binding protein [Advenella faeciporci]|uniref:ABC transporter ATP-binding protein n=1 Tax=Advenella faeciporci TaxID=797535 RepID=A0A918JQS9_9BURK|nr:ABC transporter ATP-binding protein [Advenella faeciporci]GGW95555.1 ABC transporter ATP-binding protein [Advenella faeciporci]